MQRGGGDGRLRGSDGYTGSEPCISAGGGEVMLYLFLTLSVRHRGTEYGWKVNGGQSVEEVDTTAAAGSRFSCKEVKFRKSLIPIFMLYGYKTYVHLTEYGM